MVQWLRIHLPMKATQVQSLIQEDPTCCGQLSPCTLKIMLCNKRNHCSEKPTHHSSRIAPLATARESHLIEKKTQHRQNKLILRKSTRVEVKSIATEAQREGGTSCLGYGR